MKTIKVQTTYTQEVEVTLPQFRKVEGFAGTEYFAYYSDKQSENIYFRIKEGKLIAYHAFANILGNAKGEIISQSEFIKCLNDAKETINTYGVFASVTNDEQGEYYLTDSEKEDWGSTAGEQTDDLGFQEFQNQK